MKLLRGDGRALRVGHRGAAALAPENTLASLRAAVEHGADVVEFDLLADVGDHLVLAHSRLELPHEPTTLDEALRELARTDVGVHVDLKQRGIERRLVHALRRHGLIDRSLVSSFDWSALRDVLAEEGALAVGLSYPEDRYGISGRRLVAPVVPAWLLAMRRIVPRLIGRWLARAGASAAVLHHALVTPALIARCHGLGVAVFAWTVNDAEAARRLENWGADAIITDDPRIFSAASTSDGT